MERNKGTGKYPVPFLVAVESTCGTVVCLLGHFGHNSIRFAVLMRELK